ncbi:MULTISPECIES: hypothetical protein [Tsukamurella]|uniref:YtxH domain-containing protein n=1 Tax=Tsukamurella strandjordii TaxID=147577 RepID=A0AA90NH31_9ACTN|nr:MULTISPECIES: hypothetical protein [Tsukamurella]MDP0398938.1 hypothetical protein [Tsukamurella strandjordii]GIZ95798.1 hypothetical protein TTY48_04100 [Tsukamurella sp. TY48]
MIRLVIAAGAGYVLGTKAGRRRYEQINRTAKAIATSPVTKKAVEVGRRKLADSLHPDPKMRTMREIDADTVVYSPKTDLD